MRLSAREATEDDGEAIIALITLLGRDFGVDAEVRPEYVAEYLRFPGCHLLLAEGDEAGGAADRRLVVGLLSFSLRPNLFHGADGGLIEELVVAPEARGKGVGTLLVQTAIDMMSAAGCAEAGVATGFDNQAARGLYARFGLVEESLLLERHFQDGC
jgi:ribosomal protein S18 acetylase RimI-like enzyme